jgi:hypothetical protein
MTDHRRGVHQRMSRRGHALCVVLTFAAGCMFVADGAVVHDAEGPLSVRVEGGGLSVRAPDEVPWHASFGTYLPA